MKTLLECAKYAGAHVYADTDLEINIRFHGERKLQAAYDEYFKSFEPVAYRQHIEVTKNDKVTQEFGYSEMQVMNGDDALYLHPQISSEVEPNTIAITTAEYEQLKADAERLDYLITCGGNILHGDDGYYLYWNTSNRITSSYKTPREAIDQARGKI